MIIAREAKPNIFKQLQNICIVKIVWQPFRKYCWIIPIVRSEIILSYHWLSYHRKHICHTTVSTQIMVRIRIQFKTDPSLSELDKEKAGWIFFYSYDDTFWRTFCSNGYMKNIIFQWKYPKQNVVVLQRNYLNNLNIKINLF